MRKILNITNGDSAVKIMQEAGISGIFLPWRDVLHDGPVPGDLSLEELSRVRSRFIADSGWGTPEAIRQSFVDRDQTLRSFDKFDRIILWFEHDLYDQLQILQILDWFSRRPAALPKLSIICTEQYLGMLSPDGMKALRAFETPVSQEQLALSANAWAAFRSSTPENWRGLLNTNTSALPFLEGAIIRQLEEYPDCDSGLSRSARTALEIISDGEHRPWRIFGLYQKTEERRFMGDSSFWATLHELLETRPALLELPPGKVLSAPPNPDQELHLTQAGEDALSGKRNWLQRQPTDRWIGGVHLTPDNLWCRNCGSQSIIVKRAAQH